MALRVYSPGTRKGNKFCVLRGNLGGRSYEIATATTDRRVAAGDAREWTNKLIAQPVGGHRMTFAQAACAYKEFRGPSKTDLQRLAAVEREIGTKRLRDITPGDLHAMAGKMGKDKAAATKNRNYLRPAMIVMHYAAQAGWCPYLKVKAFKEPRPKTRAVDREAALALIAAAEPGPQRLLVTWLFCQGTRISDTLRVRWEDIKIWTVVNQETGEPELQGTVKIHVSKTDATRIFPLHAEVCELLALQLGEQGFVFPWRTRSGVRWLTELAAGLGFHFTAHMARHSLGTWLNEDGAGLRTIMEALGHADVHSSIRYQGANVEIVRAAINRIGLRDRQTDLSVVDERQDRRKA